MSDEAQKEPQAENLIANAAESGWDFFEHPIDTKVQDVRRQQEQARVQRAAAIAAGLMSMPESGFPELMDYMLDLTLRRATFVAALGLPMDQAYGYGCHREGQNSLMFVLIKLIAEGRKLEPQKGRDP